MWRLIKVLFVLSILTAIAFVGFAYVGPFFMEDDFAPPVREVTQPVTLEGN